MSNTPIPNQFLQQDGFVGVDVYHPPWKLDESHVQQADNLLCVAGELVTRPGLQGLLTTPLPDPIHAPLVYVRDDGATAILFTSGGRLYYVLSTESFGLAHEVLIDGATSFALTSAQTQIVRSGKYAYIVDGQVKLTDLAAGTPQTQVTSAARPFTAGDAGKQIKVTSGTGYSYTDLALDAAHASWASSVARPFVAGDVGSKLQITGGTGFTLGIYTINSVSAGVAVLDRAAGTAGSTGGHGTLAGGLGWTLGTYTIESVSAGVATLSAAAAGSAATGGKATLSAPMYRVALASDAVVSAEAVAALLQPDPPVKATLANTVLDAMDDTGVWSGWPALRDPAALVATTAPPNVVTNGDFVGGTNHDTDPPPTGWQTGGDSMDFRPDSSGNAVYFDFGAGPQWVDWETPNYTYGVPVHAYTDLVVGSGTAVVTSAARPFVKGDVDCYLRVTGGSGFTLGTYRITAVNASHQATVSAAIGTALSTGGVAELIDYSGSAIAYARVFDVTYQNKNTEGGSGQISMIVMPEASSALTGGSNVPLDPPVYYTDLAIDGSGHLTSAARPFVSGDVGKVITITSGTGFTAGGYTITGLSGSAAILNGTAGATSSTGGAGILGLEADDTSWGHQNSSLQAPVSNAGFASSTNTLTVSSGSYVTTNQVCSLNGQDDFDFVRLRFLGPAYIEQRTYVNFVKMLPVDVRLTFARSLSSGLQISANNVNGGWCLGGNWIRRDYTARDAGVDVPDYADLAVDGDVSKVTSSARPFISGDVGRILVITGQDSTGAGTWTTGRYTIESVTAGVATLDTSVGTLTATKGEGTLLEVGTPDYSQDSALAIGYSAPATTGTPSFRLGFQEAGTKPAEIVWTNPCTLVTASTGQYLTVDASTVSSAVRARAQYVYIQIVSDLDDTVDLTNLCTLGPISAAGNLSIGFADYSYVIEEVVDTSVTTAGAATGDDDDGQIESEGSRTTAAITPNAELAQVALELPAVVNADANYWYLFRYGGTFSDSYPTARLVAKLPLWTDTLDTAYAQYVTWDHTARKVVDNTPDSVLQLAPTLATDRGAMLWGSQAVAPWQNRIWTAQGSTLAGSWLVTSSQAGGLYFNANNDPSDPNVPIKGIQVSVGGLDNDDIQALVPLGAMLIILKRRSIWMLTGTDGSNFQLSGHLLQAGVGLAAPRARATVGHQVWLLAGDGVWAYDGGEMIAPTSQLIEPYIAPQVSGGSPIDPALFSRAAMLYADRRLYLFMPKDSDSSSNDVAHVFDIRTGGWTRLLDMTVTGGCALSTALDTGQVFLAGLDGQLYQLAGSGDKATPAADAQPVSFALQTRAMGMEEGGPRYWTVNTATALQALVRTGESAVVTFSVSALDCPVVWSQGYTIAGRKGLRFPSVLSNVQGLAVWAGVSGATVTPTRITALAVEIAEGNPNT